MPATDATIAVPARGLPAALLATARPRQWLKNALVVAAPGAADALGRDDVLGRDLLALIAFCALASGIYAINDVRDAAEDRRHPTKCRRPVAAGELGEGQALTFGAVLMITGLGLCLAIRPVLALVGIGYLTLTLTYTLVWRRVPLLDVLAIAGGFLLRAIAGGVAARVDLSEWFLLVISFAAVLVAAGKRWGERQRTLRTGTLSGGRRSLDGYTASRLTALLVLSGAGTFAAYCGWAFAAPLADGIPWRPLTIVPFAACLVRYGMLVRAGKSETPDELILSDRAVCLWAATWLVLFTLEVNAGV